MNKYRSSKLYFVIEPANKLHHQKSINTNINDNHTVPDKTIFKKIEENEHTQFKKKGKPHTLRGIIENVLIFIIYAFKMKTLLTLVVYYVM